MSLIHLRESISTSLATISNGNNEDPVARDTLKSLPDKESEEKESDIKREKEMLFFNLVTSCCIPMLWQY